MTSALPQSSGTPSVTPPKSSDSKGRMIFGALIAFLLIAGVAAVLASRGGSNADSEGAANLATTQPVAVTGENLEPLGEDGTDPAVGKQVPTIVGASFDGSAITVPTPGKRTLVAIVAHWCPHCQREVPKLVEWSASGKIPADLDVAILSTAVVEERGNFPPSAWLTREKSTFPVLADDTNGRAAEALGNASFPTMVLIDASGNVVRRMSGEHSLEEIAAFAAA